MPNDRPLPTNPNGADLHERLSLQAGDTLYGMAMSSPQGDAKATRILARQIVEQQGNQSRTRTSNSIPVRSLHDRAKLAARYATDSKVAKPLRELFGVAIELTVELASSYANDFRLASPDTHHFSAKFNGASYDFETKTLAILPRPLHFATLLMNPFNPVQPAVNPMSNRTVELPLEAGRYECIAQIIAEETRLPLASIAKAGLANALHIAAWRYGQQPTADQAPIDYFLKVAEVANKAMGSPCNDSLFPRAMRAIK